MGCCRPLYATFVVPGGTGYGRDGGQRLVAVFCMCLLLVGRVVGKILQLVVVLFFFTSTRLWSVQTQ